jgi:hypothetical protein
MLVGVNMTRNFTIAHTKASYKNYCNYNKTNDALAKKYKTAKPRRSNIPEDISENLARHILIKTKLDTELSRDVSSGDLHGKRLKRIEIKTCTSDGPMSFGPKECWDNLVIQTIDIKTHGVKLYLINLSNKSPILRKIRISKMENYGECCSKGKRPHITMDSFIKQLPKNRVRLVFCGKISSL